jgi:hypothetical protein
MIHGLESFVYRFVFAEIFDFQIGFLWPAVSMTPLIIDGALAPLTTKKVDFIVEFLR